MRTELLPIDSIRIDSSFNCRGDITPHSVFELSQDIKKNGLLQPVVVGPVEADGKRLLIAGYRRAMAHKLLKRTEIYCTIRDDMVDHNQLLLMNLRENVQRVDLNLVQEAKAIEKLFALGLIEQQVAKELNKPVSWVSLRNMVRQLPAELHPNIIEGTFTNGHIKELYDSMLHDPRDVFVEKVKWLKDQRAKGRKNVTLKQKEAEDESATGKKHRSSTECYQMQAKIHTSLYMGHIASMALGWAAGSITTVDFEEAIRNEVEKEGLADG